MSSVGSTSGLNGIALAAAHLQMTQASEHHADSAEQKDVRGKLMGFGEGGKELLAEAYKKHIPMQEIADTFLKAGSGKEGYDAVAHLVGHQLDINDI